MQVARSRFFDVIVSPRPPGRAERPAGAALASRPTRPSMDATLCRVVLPSRAGRPREWRKEAYSFTYRRKHIRITYIGPAVACPVARDDGPPAAERR